MKYFKNKILFILTFGMLVLATWSCTKIEPGYINPNMYYVNTQFVVPRGQTKQSNTLVSNGSNTPLDIKIYHIYDSTGKIVDDLFNKKYPVTTWKTGYDASKDVTYSAIIQKLEYKDLPAILISSGGTITVTSASLNIPSGSYMIDLIASNPAGTEILKNAMQLILTDPVLVETNDSKTGNPGIGIALAGTASVKYLYNTFNIPYMSLDVQRIADTPNVIIYKVVDKNGVTFNPNTEIIPRPGVVQNLQYYQPDTYTTTDTSMQVKYPIAPFPVASKGNAYLWYYNIKSSAVKLDSTTTWSSNPSGELYQGVSDPHYLGTYKLDRYDLSFKNSLIIQVPGTYIITQKILIATHR